MSPETVGLLLGTMIGAAGLFGGWLLASRSRGHGDGKLEASFEALAEKVETLGSDSRLAWTKLGSEILEFRRDLTARDRRIWERWDQHDRQIVRLEEWRRAMTENVAP